MRKLGWRVTGLEPDKSAAEVASERYGISVTDESVEGSSLPPSQFDVITLHHVIEHVYNPIEVLRKCRLWLRAGGLIIVWTPNLGSLGHRVFGEHWMHLDPPRHLHLFTREAMRVCAVRAGLNIKGLDTSTAGAPETYDVSRVVRRRGTCDLVNFPSTRSPRSRLFRLKELHMRAWTGDGGEEIVLVATK
jgi:2-polyprenyl-3-methyl-5-hydroxy-6-metoxy-1,4-benzoquinol methylase